MREGFDKEIDSLLRRTARAPAGARGNGSSASRPDTHLDADELAAFAEGALPEAARMNVVSHIADCGECRSLAVNLTRAAGVEVELEKRAAASSSSPSRAKESKPARGWLAALFAPRTLRYVAPALVVCLVAAVSFIALRSRSGSGLVSLQDRNTGARPSIATTEGNSQPSFDGQAAPDATTSASANSNANTTTTTTGEGVESKDKAAPEVTTAQPIKKDAETDAPDGSTTGPLAGSKAAGEDDAAQPKPAKEIEDAPAAASPPAPVEVAKSAPSEAPPPAKYRGENMKAGPPPSQKQADEVASNDQSQQRAATPRNYEPQAPDGSRGRSRVGSNNSASGGALASPRDNRDVDARRENAAPARRGGAAQNERLDDGRAANTSEEFRTVAGHRFRREGGAWVDVKYKPSMSSTGVRRGTEAYRGLVADFPEIRSVAEQLGGAVTVVVRGRAYSIR